jgi:hypothetical protein
LGLLEVGKISVELEKFLENIGEGSGSFANLENWKRYSQDITNPIWNLPSNFGILLDMVEGSGKVLFGNNL